jgi:hypothetical protein
MERKLSDEDIAAIVAALKKEDHECRFSNITKEDLDEAVKFYKNFNKVIGDTNRTILKTITVIGITGLASLLVLGAISKIKQFLLP